jgi:periplasmic divalent cation tolerance protein
MSPAPHTSANQPTDVVLLYSTAPNSDIASALAEKIITHKLAACVNILPEIHSIYRWNNEVQHSTEVAMILKTTRAQFEGIQAVFAHDHPYETPCLLMLEVSDGNPPFLAWVSQQLS